ncbi:MAG: hypothetical protein KGH61_01455 [Candidatus Micrarchaeota archaeon]|nr:hypothetical protein [Candidatus Micrarchaeota archaeon]MDE1847597.1 hypothetical protein [Candidatus Micrarchaeota archaeon]MDE1863800.1 hypothetical protein [Candidatus Micrarchaeota archaeon]
MAVKYLIEIGKNEASFRDIAYILNQVQSKEMDEQKVKAAICGSFGFDDWGGISDDGNSFKLLKPTHPFLAFLLK